MGDLPEDRVNIARAFVHTSLDFLGPIEIQHSLRGKRTGKTYVCVFVCLTTKAVHLEAATDLSIDGFIGCLKRFIARRGLVKKIICDNGTNFRGAHNQLEEIYDLIVSSKGDKVIKKYCKPKQIEWFSHQQEARILTVLAKQLLNLQNNTCEKYCMPRKSNATN